MNTWIYILDEFKPVDIDTDKLFELVEKNPMGLFYYIRGIIEEYVEDIEDVDVYRVYLDEKTTELVIEYIVRTSSGRVSVKLIHSENPKEALRSYYQYEKLT